jgi:hypothetical protein
VAYAYLGRKSSCNAIEKRYIVVALLLTHINMALDYQDALLIIKNETWMQETDVLSKFIELNWDERKWMWDEWAVRAYESEEFSDFVLEYASELDEEFYEELKKEKYTWN